MEISMKCPQCEIENGQRKHGKNKSGSQRYYCSHCKKTYTPNPFNNEYTEEEKTTAIKIYFENSSGRAVGRILGMSKSNVFRWIKQRATKIPEPNPETAENTEEPIDAIELDELFHFVKKKSDKETKENVYVTLAVTRNPRKIVGFTVTLSRSVEQMRGLVDSSPAANTYYSDGFKIYNEISYWGCHIVAPGKSETYTVEGVNSDLRHYIPGLARRRKCFYRSLDTLYAVMKLFVYAYNRFGEYKAKHQKLASHRPESKSRLHKYAELPLGLTAFF
jgi:transposase-like protein/IS1 family transposase